MAPEKATRLPPAIPTSTDYAQPLPSPMSHQPDPSHPLNSTPTASTLSPIATATCHLSTQPFLIDPSKPSQQSPDEKPHVSFSPMDDKPAPHRGDPSDTGALGNLFMMGDSSGHIEPSSSSSSSSRGRLYDSLQGSGRWVGGQVGKLVSHAGGFRASL
jgi:hypothetical protein